MFQEQDAKQFALDWYRLVDAHSPVMELVSRVARDLVVSFPGRKMDLKDYIEWYAQDIRSNFNGKHDVHSLTVTMKNDSAEVFMEITWTAEFWKAPTPKSEKICLYPNVTLTLVPDGSDGILLKYYGVVDRKAIP